MEHSGALAKWEGMEECPERGSQEPPNRCGSADDEFTRHSDLVTSLVTAPHQYTFVYNSRMDRSKTRVATMFLCFVTPRYCTSQSQQLPHLHRQRLPSPSATCLLMSWHVSCEANLAVGTPILLSDNLVQQVSLSLNETENLASREFGTRPFFVAILLD